MAAQNSAAIRSMVIPLDQELMLLPGSIVAEVALYNEPEPASANAPAWLIGFMPWRGQRVPLVSMEAFVNKKLMPVPSAGSRVAIIKTLDPTLGFPFYGLLSRQMPRLVLVEADAMGPVSTEEAPPRARIAAEVYVNEQRMMIPDVEALEKGLWAVLPA